MKVSVCEIGRLYPEKGLGTTVDHDHQLHEKGQWNRSIHVASPCSELCMKSNSEVIVAVYKLLYYALELVCISIFSHTQSRQQLPILPTDLEPY